MLQFRLDGREQMGDMAEYQDVAVFVAPLSRVLGGIPEFMRIKKIALNAFPIAREGVGIGFVLGKRFGGGAAQCADA